MNPDRTGNADESRLIEDLFDGGLVGDDRERAMSRIGRSPKLRAEAMAVSGMVAGLRDTPGLSRRGPDLADSVLAEVDRRRGFVSGRVRRAMPWVRGSIAACLLMGLLGVTVAQLRYGIFRLHEAPAPLTEVSTAVGEGYSESGRAAADGARVLRASLVPLSAGSIENPLDAVAGSLTLDVAASDAGAMPDAQALLVRVRARTAEDVTPGWSADLFAGASQSLPERRDDELDALP